MELKVMGFKALGRRSIFKAVQDDAPTVDKEDIITTLPDPAVNTESENIVYIFQRNIDVEKIC
jgi:hypothetical protein